jgi:mannosyltransferase OCH1-like enzyme
MIPKIIHQTTSRETLTWEEERLAARLRRLLPDWTYKLWRDPEKSAIMREQFPHYADLYERLPLGVMRADVARYAFLYAQGGVYLDTDYKLRRPFGPDFLAATCVIPLEHDAGDIRMDTGLPGGPGLGNAVLATAPHYPFWRDFIDSIFESPPGRDGDPEAGVLASTGPDAMTRFFLANRDRYPEIETPARNLFHPHLSLFAMRSSADAATYGVHLCWGSWRGRPPLTALRKLVRRKLNAI